MEINTYSTEGFIDLHVHTDYSSVDKEYMNMNLSPKKLLKETKEFSDKFNCPITIAVTDHDNILGSKEIRDLIKENPEEYNNVKFISGAEFTVSCESLGTYINKYKQRKSIFHSIHLLGYNFDLDDKTLNYYSKIKSMELGNTFVYENHKYSLGGVVLAGKKFLNQKGYKLPLSQFTNFQIPKSMKNDKSRFINTVQSFTDFCRYNIKINESDLRKMYNFLLGLPEDFKKYETLNQSSVSFKNVVENAKLDIEEMMAIIQDAGGVSVLAHPNLIRYHSKYVEYRTNKRINDEFLPILKKFDQKFTMGNFNMYTKREMDKKRDILEYVVAKLTDYAHDPISGRKLSGIVGIEALHSINIYKNYFSIVTDLAERYNLYITGGSDKHGSLSDHENGKVLSLGQVMPLVIENIFPKLDETKSMFSIFSCKLVDDILNNEFLRRKTGNTEVELLARTPKKVEIFDYNNTKRFIEKYGNHYYYSVLNKFNKHNTTLNPSNIKIDDLNYDIEDLNSRLDYYNLDNEETFINKKEKVNKSLEPQ